MKSKNRMLKVALFLVINAAFAIGQNFKTELRILDPSEEKLNASLHITSINQVQFDQLIQKSKALNLYTVSSEYFEEKKTGYISFNSNSFASIKDFQSSLKQLEISNVDYNGKNISIQEIESNYKPINKSEIQNVQRNK